jgi:diaminopimelate epimerase
MRLKFTKMQGAGNDFVVLDATRQPFSLNAGQLRHLGDRHFGIGADQILVIEPPASSEFDFRYRIFNGASGEEVEHCGNGARCFVRFVHEHGLSERNPLRVETVNNRLALSMRDDGAVSVNMNQPSFALEHLPFNADGLVSRPVGDFELWPLVVMGAQAELALLSMGNPHAVLRVDGVDDAPVSNWGPFIENHPRFPRRVNVGFMAVKSRHEIDLRVHERDAGETLACGTGACAAVVAGIRLGWLDAKVDVHTRGGLLQVEWAGVGQPVWMTGPAVTVFEGEIEL